MPKTFICSTGTSAAKVLSQKPSELTTWVKQYPGVEQAAEALFSNFKSIPPEEKNLKHPLSAEIHSLVRMGISHNDRILLLASDTDDGCCCALAVSKYFELYWQGVQVETKRILGLQVNDAEQFRTQGVVEFVKVALREIDAWNRADVILNPTGGFKALVPYMVLIGMLKGVDCQYIFEQSSNLLDLPPLPVEFKRSQFEAYRHLFEQIEQENSISQTLWESTVPYEEREWFEPLIEKIGAEITLSAVGFLFLEAVRERSTLVPFLSRKAYIDCFDNLVKVKKCDPIAYLQRVARDRQTLESAKHHQENGLYWLKPGGHTTDRYLVSVEGWRLLIWRAIREDQEGKDYADKVKVNTSDRQTYYPFMRMEFYEL